MAAERNTLQREAIQSALLRADRPLGPQEVLAAARTAVPGLGLATVYRNLKRLAAEGWLKTVAIPGGADRYEVAGKGHHHHFHCRACDGVFEIEDCPGNLRDLTPHGFVLERHEIFLFGVCTACR